MLEYTAQRNSASKPSSSNRSSDLAQFQISSSNCELLEFLADKSVWTSSGERHGNGSMWVELLAFDRNDGEAMEKPDFSLKMTRDAQVSFSGLILGESQVWILLQRYECSVSLRPCRTEFDVSLVDRLCNLFFCQPNFKKACNQQQQQMARQKYLFEVPPINDLVSALFFEVCCLA